MQTQFRLWKYIKPHLRDDDMTNSPLHINFNDIANMESKLHERVWMLGGLVVQKIYYGNYSNIDNTFLDPVIIEKWDWDIDNRIDIVNKRTITTQGYGVDNDSEPLPDTVTTIKQYVSITSKLKEIERRRYNRVYDLREIVVKKLIDGRSDEYVAEAIVNSTNLTYYLKEQFDEYIRFGNTTICDSLRNPSEHIIALFPYLLDDMEVPGIGNGTMHNVMSDMLGILSYDLIKDLDRKSLT